MNKGITFYELPVALAVLCIFFVVVLRFAF
jgi:hypothetical protein